MSKEKFTYEERQKMVDHTNNDMGKIFNDVLMNTMQVDDLGKMLNLRVDIASHVYGYGSLGHSYALMAKMMYEQIISFLTGTEVNDVTCEDAMRILNPEEFEGKDE